MANRVLSEDDVKVLFNDGDGLDENVACENKADDGEPCGNEGRYYPDYQMYLCGSCADGYGAYER